MNPDFPSYERAERYPTETAGLDSTLSVGIETCTAGGKKKVVNLYSGEGEDVNKVNTSLSKEDIRNLKCFHFIKMTDINQTITVYCTDHV